jgi:hypothetical protein
MTSPRVGLDQRGVAGKLSLTEDAPVPGLPDLLAVLPCLPCCLHTGSALLAMLSAHTARFNISNKECATGASEGSTEREPAGAGERREAVQMYLTVLQRPQASTNDGVRDERLCAERK